ncbi:putative NRPS-like protein biosynthetic cluster [Microsporum ferrugineum]
MAHLSQEHVQHLYRTFGELKVLDDIIRHRAADESQVPILGYPKFEHSVDDYERFTGKQLDLFVDAAAKEFILAGIKPNQQRPVALLAPSNVDFVVSFFALSRIGCTVLCLSLRIPPIAIINLLRKTECDTMVHGRSKQIESKVHKVHESFPLKALEIPIRCSYDRLRCHEPPFVREYDREKECERVALIMHSSGSTGLPKPVFLTHKAVLQHPPQGSGLHNFNALPWYHMYGLSTAFQAMWMRKTAHLYNALLPLTGDNLVAVIEATKPEAVHTVPYVLGLLAEKSRGVEALKACKVVTSAGAKTPDELGDRLVKEGINLGVVFGTTEAGLCGDTMRREKGDDTWNYIRIYANIRKHLHMHLLGDNLYEFVYLKGHPGLSTSNSDVPAPGSWHSRDVFTPHATIPDVWKFVTRIDDRVTLANGEKVLPLPIEGRIREDELVREATVVGVDQAIPGLLVFRSKEADHMSDETYLEAIWPSVADANSRSEEFSQVTKDMITLIPSNVNYPQTDKGSVIRAQVYDKFADIIEAMYTRLEGGQEGSLKLDLPSIEQFLMQTCRDTIGVALETPETDFFSVGVDSLKAIQMRRIIQKTIELNGTRLNPNIVYEKGNVKELARYLHALGHGGNVPEVDGLQLMQQLIDRYSGFQRQNSLHHVTNGNISKTMGQAVVLTGATGSIGAHVLARFVADDRIEKIYCLARGANPMQRILSSLKNRSIDISIANQRKVSAFTADLNKPGFGLDASTLAQMKKEVSLIIHIAWPVNFNIHLRSFEPHIAGLYNLLQFSLSVEGSRPAQLFFCSSISTAFNTPAPASIRDGPIEELGHAASMGYSQSKLVGEHIVQNAYDAGALSYVLRIGQVVGDTDNGLWNDKEFIPMIIKSAFTLEALPDLQERCSWIPVDILATIIFELSWKLAEQSPVYGSPRESSSSIYYNIVNPHTFHWHQLLQELLDSSFLFNAIPTNDWLVKLRESAEQEDEAVNPAITLIEYFEREHSVDKGLKGGGLDIETHAVQRDTTVLKNPPRIIEDGLVAKFLARWLQRWLPERKSKGLPTRPAEYRDKKAQCLEEFGTVPRSLGQIDA